MKWRPSEEHLGCIDDYMCSRGQHSSNEEGRQGLKDHFPSLTDEQITIAMDVWEQEMKDSAPEWFEERDRRNKK